MSKEDKLPKENIDARELQRLKHIIELIKDDISGTKPLSTPYYNELMSDLKSRLNEEEWSELFLSIHEDIEGLDKLSENLDSPGMHAAGEISSILSSGLKLIGYRRMGRKLTWGERIIVGLCIAAIALAVASFGVGIGVFLGAGLAALGITLSVLAIVRAVISFAKTWQTLRVKEAQLLDTECLAANSELMLEKLLSTTKESPSADKQDKPKSLKAVVEQYIAQGYIIHQLRDALHTPRKKRTNQLHLLMGAFVIIGAVLLFFPPLALIGACIMGVAGLISTGAVLNNWVHHRHEMQKISPARASVIRKELTSKTLEDLIKANILKTPQERRYAEILAGYQRSAPSSVKCVVTPTAPRPIDHDLPDSTVQELSQLKGHNGSSKPVLSVDEHPKIPRAPRVAPRPIDFPSDSEETKSPDKADHETPMG